MLLHVTAARLNERVLTGKGTQCELLVQNYDFCHLSGSYRWFSRRSISYYLYD